MAIQTIYIVRHGYRSNWLPPPHPPNPTGVDSDPVLAEHGVEQSKELANYITNELTPKPKIIISSPFYRCIQTANPTANSLHIPIFLDKGIGEFYKKDRNVIPEPAPFKTMQTFFPNVSNEWEWDTVIPSTSGEDESDIFDRCSQFWEIFFKKFESQFPNIETVMFISHAATKIALGMTLLKNYESVRDKLKDEDNVDGESNVIKSGTCAIDKYVKDRDNDKWNIKINGFTDYLEKGEEMNWHFISNVEAGSNEDIERRRKLAEQEEKSLKENSENDDAMDIDSEKVNEDDEEEDDDLNEDEEEDNEDDEEEDDDDDDDDEDEDDDEDRFVKEEERDDEEYEDVFVKLSVPPKGKYSDKHSIGSTAFQMLSGNTNNGRSKTENRYNGSENITNSNSKSSKNSIPKLLNSRLYAPITSSSTMQIVGMETDKPILQIDKEIFEGDWGKLIGTELIFNDSGDCVTKVDGHLTFKQGKLLPKTDEPKKKENLFVRAMELAKSVSGKDKSENKVEAKADAETNTQLEVKTESKPDEQPAVTIE